MSRGTWLTAVAVLALASRTCAQCVGDTDLNGMVDLQDLTQIIVDWDCTNPPDPCPGDVTNDGVTNVSDLVAVIVAWGPCPTSPCRCSGGDTPEGEPCGASTNAGCNITPQVFGAVACGETVCGTAWGIGGMRDTDWYLFTVGAADTYSCTLESDFPGVAFLVAGLAPCNPLVLATAVTMDCIPATGSSRLGPGTYAIFVGASVFDGFPCGSTSDYRVTLACGPVGAMCGDPGTGDCYEAHATPFCDDEDCCLTVCATDPFCCDVEWDVICVDEAVQLCEGPGAPPNDLCEEAIPVSAGDSVMGTTLGATIDPFPFCGTSITAPGVWYSIVGTGNTITASTCNQASYDTKISVYCMGCDMPTCVDGLDDTAGCADFTTQLSWCTQPGAQYLILVHGFSSGVGSFTLTITDDGVPCSPTVLCTTLAAP